MARAARRKPIRLVRPLLAGLALALVACGACAAEEGGSWYELYPFTGPCAGNCATAIYAGWYVDNSMGQVLVTSPETPFTWDYEGDYLVATTISRRIATLWKHVDVEPEIGVGQRWKKQDETEVWGAFFFRWRGFPWDDRIVTTAAVSTGFNYATDISDKEKARAKDGEGSRLMHFFAPEITFALPSHPEYELMFRFHHRSGVFGLVSDAWGGAQYGTIGLRVRF
ncbi:hypothetical protein [Amaricoccus sp.]|uniref:hypothetical protein n=1 Tax=Amaricoccus sp. TaxID=1872485 RepID=UPI001B688A3D|nr:hypothetical protein [Amaricoccus sp.]MBP7001281.1 hypothetical protein [Amaricoccus sp.]